MTAPRETKPTTAALLGELTGSESKREVSLPTVQVTVDYCPVLRSAVILLKKENSQEKKKNSKVVTKFPNRDKYHLCRFWPICTPKTLVDEKLSITLTLKDISALISEFNIYTNRNKKLVADNAKNLSFVNRYLYLRKANKEVEKEELIVAQAKAYLMQKVLEELKKEIAIPKPTIPLENEETPTNFLQRWVKQIKSYVIRKILSWFKKSNTTKTQGQANDSDSNSYKSWIAFSVLMFCYYIPGIGMSLYWATESMTSLSPYLFFISPHALAAVGVICTVNIIVGMICLYGPTIMNWFNIYFSNSTPKLHSVYQQQLEAANSINNHLIVRNNLSAKIFENYVTFSRDIGTIPSQKKEESVFVTLATWGMTALTGVEAFSVSIMMGATILGLLAGAFTLAASGPLVPAFVAGHLLSVFLMSIPLASAHCLMNYILRVTSTSKLFDIYKGERDAVEKMRVAYQAEQPSARLQLYLSLYHKKDFEKSKKNVEPEARAKETTLETEKEEVIKKRIGLLFAHGQPVLMDEYAVRHRCLPEIIKPETKNKLKSTMSLSS